MSIVYDKHSMKVASSKNLRAMLDAARKYDGVKLVRITRMRTAVEFIDSKDGAAVVRVTYNTGHFAEDEFVSFSHCVEWANARSKRKGTWWTGCTVEVAE